MRASDLRQLQPFLDAVDGYVATLSRDTTSCRCSLNEAGRWTAPTTGCVGERGCRQVLRTVVRAHLARIRVPVEHLTDVELECAVIDLRALTLRAAQLSSEEFAEGVQRALHADRVATPHRP